MESTPFEIDEVTGNITTVEALDREEIMVYNLVATAQDSAGSTSTAQVNVVVVDINDNAPVFEQPSYTAYKLDDSSLQVTPLFNGSIISIHAYDIDQPNSQNSQVRYQLAGAEAHRFIVDPSSADIEVAKGIYCSLASIRLLCAWGWGLGERRGGGRGEPVYSACERVRNLGK